MKKEDLKPNEIYFGLHGDCNVIFMPNEYEIYDNDRFYNSNYPDALEQIRVAAQEEKDWLNACIEANKFVPREEVNKKEFNKFEPGKTYSFYWDWNSGYEITDAICKSYDDVFVKVASYYNKTDDYKSTEGWFRLSEIKNIKEQVPVKDDKAIPEYIECIKRDNSIEIGKIYQIQIEKGFEYNNMEKVYFINNKPYYQSYFKLSTKEAFDAQNKPKSVEKWSEGTYVVAIKDYTYFKFGNIGEIEDGAYGINDDCVDISKSIGKSCMPFKEYCKWFATKSEAEEFAKTLLNSNNMFKKDDYIVFTEADESNNQSGDNSFPLNYVFKQREDLSYLSPYLDYNGHKENGWEYCRNFNNNFFISYLDIYKSKWRYATKEEIAEYNRLGKPFNVTTLNKKEDWKIDYQNMLDIEVGDTVRCIPFNKSKFNGYSESAGAGWKENLEIKVQLIDDYGDYKVYFPETGNGVYSDAVRLVKRKDSEDNLSGKYEYWSKEHKAELLEEIKRKYPIGSKFECLHGCTGGPINNYNEIDLKDKGFIRWYGDDGVGCLYSENRENKWAKVIYDSPISLMIDDVFQKYPLTPEECFKKSNDDLVITYDKIKENIVKIDFSKNQEEKDSFKVNLVNKNNKNKLVTIKF